MAKYLSSPSLAANALPDKITAVSLLLSQVFSPEAFTASAVLEFTTWPPVLAAPKPVCTILVDSRSVKHSEVLLVGWFYFANIWHWTLPYITFPWEITFTHGVTARGVEECAVGTHSAACPAWATSTCRYTLCDTYLQNDLTQLSYKPHIAITTLRCTHRLFAYTHSVYKHTWPLLLPSGTRL